MTLYFYDNNDYTMHTISFLWRALIRIFARSHIMNMYMKYVYNMYKYETVSLVNREVPQLFRICGQSSAPRRKIGQRERICKASSRIISLLEGAFAPTTRKRWEEGGWGRRKGGVLCKEFKTERSRWEKRKRTRRNEIGRAGGEEWKLGSKYGPVSPTS